MKMSNKAYDVWKWLIITVFPALITLFGVIAQQTGFEWGSTVVVIANAVLACLGTCLGISSVNYHASITAAKAEEEAAAADDEDTEDA